MLHRHQHTQTNFGTSIFTRICEGNPCSHSAFNRFAHVFGHIQIPCV